MPCTCAVVASATGAGLGAAGASADLLGSRGRSIRKVVSGSAGCPASEWRTKSRVGKNAPRCTCGWYQIALAET